MDYPPITPYGLGPSNRASMDLIFNHFKNVE